MSEKKVIKSFEDLDVFRKAYDVSLRYTKRLLASLRSSNSALGDKSDGRANPSAPTLLKDLPNSGIQALSLNGF